MKNSLLSILVSTLLATTALSAAAQPPPQAGDQTESFAHLEMLADRLGLSEQQEEEINRLLNASQLETAVDRERARQIRDQLQALVSDFDAGQVQILAQELGEITSRLTYAATAIHAEIQSVFSAEQLAQLEAMKSERPAGPRGPRFGHAAAAPPGE